MLAEVLALFKEMTTLAEVRDEEWRRFSEGLSRILSCFHQLHFDSLNMTLLANMEREEDFCVQARIIPRVSIPPLGISDVNYI